MYVHVCLKLCQVSLSLSHRQRHISFKWWGSYMAVPPLGGAMALDPIIGLFKQMWTTGRHRHVHSRDRQLKECKLSQRGICVGIWHTERGRKQRGGKKKKRRDCGWYLGSVLGWAPVCGRAAWILSWCLSCRPALSHCNENKYILWDPELQKRLSHKPVIRNTTKRIRMRLQCNLNLCHLWSQLI